MRGWMIPPDRLAESPFEKGGLGGFAVDWCLTPPIVSRYSEGVVYLGGGSGCRVGGHDGSVGEILIMRRSRSTGVRSGGTAFYVRCSGTWRIIPEGRPVTWPLNIHEKAYLQLSDIYSYFESRHRKRVLNNVPDDGSIFSSFQGGVCHGSRD